MAFQSIKRILPGAIKEVGLETQITTVQVLQVAQDVLKRMWGEEQAVCVIPKSYVDGVLKLQTTIPAAAQQLRVQEIPLMNEINRTLGAKKVLKLQCFVL